METILHIQVTASTSGAVNVKENPIDCPKSAYDEQLAQHARLALAEARRDSDA